MIKGDTARAIRHYQKSLKLDPGNQNAAKWIKQLKEKKQS